MSEPRLRFIPAPKMLPPDPEEGMIVMLDVAFVAGPEVEKITFPWIHQVGERLAGWIDHHSHKEWHRYENDPRFILVPRQNAPACPELVTPEIVERFGTVDHLFAHGDFDGCMTAAKYLRGGLSPYPESDEDARAIDSPGKGYECTARGLRLDRAIDQAGNVDPAGQGDLLLRIADSLVTGHEPSDLGARLDELEQERLAHEQQLRPLVDGAIELHPQVLLLRVDRELNSPDKTMLLRLLEDRVMVGLIREPGHTTAATYQDQLDGGLNLGQLKGMRGFAGYAWGQTKPEVFLDQLTEQIEAFQALALTSTRDQ